MDMLNKKYQDKYINMAKQWIKDHPGEPYNFYKA